MPAKDPTLPIRKVASQYAGVDEGTACTQSSFKTNNKGFLYIGEQGGRYKAMFKLSDSLPEAARLSEKHPDDFQVGSTAWVTARFSESSPLPTRLWKKWLAESYQLAAGISTPRNKKESKKKSRWARKRRSPIKKSE